MKIRDFVSSTDIVLNDYRTYPSFVRKMKTTNSLNEYELNNFLVNNNFSIVGLHTTRLTENEIEQIKNARMNCGDKDCLVNKVKNLPNSIDNSIKNELLEFLKTKTPKADNCICCGYGYLDLIKDVRKTRIFAQYWGGETIYDYYTDDTKKNQLRLRYIEKKLNEISYPCVVLLRIPYYLFSNSITYHSLYSLLLDNCYKNITGSLNVYTKHLEVIDIIKLDSEYLVLE